MPKDVEPELTKETVKNLDIPVFEEEPKEVVIKTVKAIEVTTPGFSMAGNWQRWFDNTLKFLAPLAILYSGFVVGNINLDGFQLTDFVPNEFVLGGVSLYVLNTIQDFFRKYLPSQTILLPK